MKIIGIYKITSPSGRIYIGQSRHVKSRWRAYKSGLAKQQTRLHASFKKYGVETHIFEMIEICAIAELNKREHYHQEAHSVFGLKGLNCARTDPEGKTVYLKPCSETHRARLKAAKQNVSPETGAKISKALKGRVSPNKGKKLSPEKLAEHTEKMRNRKVKGRPKLPPKKRMYRYRKRKKKGKIVLPKTWKRLINEFGFIFDSVVEAAKIYGMSSATLNDQLNGRTKKNKTDLKYYNPED